MFQVSRGGLNWSPDYGFISDLNWSPDYGFISDAILKKNMYACAQIT